MYRFLLMEMKSYLKYISTVFNGRFRSMLLSIVLFSIKTWSINDPFCLNPHWYCPIFPLISLLSLFFIIIVIILHVKSNGVIPLYLCLHCYVGKIMMLFSIYLAFVFLFILCSSFCLASQLRTCNISDVAAFSPGSLLFFNVLMILLASSSLEGSSISSKSFLSIFFVSVLVSSPSSFPFFSSSPFSSLAYSSSPSPFTSPSFLLVLLTLLVP